jgi:hypothetical protein
MKTTKCWGLKQIINRNGFHFLHLPFAHFPFSSALVHNEEPRKTRQKAAINRRTPNWNDFPPASVQFPHTGTPAAAKLP